MTKTIYEIRRENLTDLLAEPGAKTQLALDLGVSQARITHLVSGTRTIKEDVARSIEKARGRDPGSLDVDRDAPPPLPGKGMTSDDIELLEATVRVVLATLKDAGTDLGAAKAGQLVRMAFTHGKERGKVVDRAYVRDLIKLTH